MSCFVTNESHPARSAHRSVRRSPPAAVRSSRRDSRALPARARYSSSSTRRARIRSSRMSSTARSGLPARSRSDTAALALTSALPERAFTGEYDRLFGSDDETKTEMENGS